MTKLSNNHLTNQQLHVLKIIYKFRFVTSDLVSKYRGVDVSTTNRTFKVLLRRELLARRYDKEYKLQNKGARYYLAPQSFKLLKPERNINEQVLHARYKDKSVGSLFIEHCIDIMATCIDIRTAYTNNFSILTKAEINGYDFFPQPLPDLYLCRNEENNKTNEINNYFIDILPDNLFFVIKTRINQYFDHYESDEWDSNQYPTILLICQSKTIAQKANKYIEANLDDKFLYDYELPIKAIEKNELTSNI